MPKYGKVWRRGRYSYRWVYHRDQRRKQRKTKNGDWKFYGKVYALAAGVGWVTVKFAKAWVYFHGVEWNIK